MRHLLKGLWIPLLCSLAFGQGIEVSKGMVISKGMLVAPGTPPITFVQSGYASPSGVYQASVTMSTGNLTAGNLYVIYSDSGQLGDGTFSPVFVAGAQTYTLGTSAGSNVQLAGVGCSNGLNSVTWIPRCTYVLPSYTNGGTSPLTFYFIAPTAGSVTSGTFTVGETVTQATSGATGIVYYPVPVNIGNNGSSMVIYKVTGSPDNSHIWTGGTSGATFTPTAVPQTATGHVFITEWHPGVSPSQVGLDNDTAQWIPTASTTITGPAQTSSGTSPIQTCAVIGDTGNIAISAVNAPYSAANQNYSAGTQEGFAGAQTTTPCAWTITSATAFTRGMTFSYNPSPFTEGMYIGFDSCTNGSSLTAACLAASTLGFSGGNWADQGPQNGKMTAGTAANKPPISPPGRLGDGSNTAAGAGTLGTVFTGDGASQERWAFTPGDSFQSSYSTFGPISFGMWFNWDANCSTSGGNFISLKGVNGNNYVDANVKSACNIEITTQGGTDTTSSWAIITNEWYWIDIYFSNNASTNHTIKLYTATPITGASCTAGTTTLTTAGLPADGNVITGKTIVLEDASPAAWNGTFSSITVSGNNVSYAQTCPGPAYSSGGYIVAQLGTTLTGTAQTVNWTSIFYGVFSGADVPGGGFVYFDSMLVNFSGLDPLLP
jgi:hypothetical protein